MTLSIKHDKDKNIIYETNSRLFIGGSIIRMRSLLESFIFIESWFIAAPSPKEKQDLRRIFFSRNGNILVRSEKQQNGSFFLCMRNNWSVLIGCGNSLELWPRSKAHAADFIRKLIKNTFFFTTNLQDGDYQLILKVES